MNVTFGVLTTLWPLAIAAGFAGCVDPIEPASDVVTSELENAPEDPVHKFAVGVCGGPLTRGTSGTCTANRCTGTLIAPNLVLTARHCVNTPVVNNVATLCVDRSANFFDPASVLAPTSVRITVDPSTIEGDPSWYKVAEILQPPGTHACDDDVALLVLENDVHPSETRPIRPELFNDLANQQPSELAIVGRGVIKATWNVVTGEPVLFDRGGLRRRVLEHIPVRCVSNQDGVCGQLLYYLIPEHGFELSTGVLMFGLSTHSGDSGAGWIEQTCFTRNRPSVIAVNSTGGVDSEGIQYAGAAVRLDRHRSFVIDGAIAAAAAGGYPVPEWVTPAPGPGPSCRGPLYDPS